MQGSPAIILLINILLIGTDANSFSSYVSKGKEHIFMYYIIHMDSI